MHMTVDKLTLVCLGCYQAHQNVTTFNQSVMSAENSKMTFQSEKIPYEREDKLLW